jgi:Tat protein secretion system quality control protein TatD with DNase activity
LSNARNLVLWLLEQGYTPQHLKLTHETAAEVETALEREINQLINEGNNNLAKTLQQSQQPIDNTIVSAINEIGLDAYANPSNLHNRLTRLKDSQGRIQSDELSNITKILAVAKTYLKTKKINQAIHLLISAAEQNPYDPWLEVD